MHMDAYYGKCLCKCLGFPHTARLDQKLVLSDVENPAQVWLFFLYFPNEETLNPRTLIP